MVLFQIHAFCSTKLKEPLIFTGASATQKSSPRIFSLSLSSSSGVAVCSSPPNSVMEDDGTYIRSPIIAFSKLLFPLPTSPIMQRNSPFLMQRSISYKVMNFPRLFLVSSFSSSSTFALSFFFLLSFSLSFFLLSLLSVSFSFELNPQLKLPLILTYPIYEGS